MKNTRTMLISILLCLTLLAACQPAPDKTTNSDTSSYPDISASQSRNTDGKSTDAGSDIDSISD